MTDQHERATDTRGRPLPSADELRGTARRHEDTSSTFRVAPSLSAAETSRRLNVALAGALRDLADRPPLGHPTVTHERLMRWHRAVFGGLFRRDAGRTRRPYEDVVFSNVYMDRQGIEFQMVFHGSPGNDIEPRLQTACSAFAVVQQRHADGNAALSEVATELARLIAQILVIHPFVDGNHRIALVAVQAVIRDITGTIAVIPDNQGLGADLELALLGEAYIAPLAGRLLAALDPSS